MPEQLVKLLRLVDRLQHKAISNDDFLHSVNELIPELPPQTDVAKSIAIIRSMEDGYFYNLEN